MKHNPAHYEELINLEALDRSLNADVARFMGKGDREGATLAELARQEAQNRMLQITLEDEEAK